MKIIAEKIYREWHEFATIKPTEKFTSVWDAIEDTPQAARNMKIRADLMMTITRLTSVAQPLRH